MMKLALFFLGIVLLGLGSIGLALRYGSPLAAWFIGYFTAVAVQNIDKRIFRNPNTERQSL